MKFLIPFIFIFSTFSLAADIYDFDLKNTKGETIYLKNFKGKSVLIVNIATRCGYTNQLDDLEALYQKYKSKGLVIIAVPSNDFGSQTPEENEEVVKFCKINYGVSFPITTKMSIKGPQQAKLFSFLTQATGGRDISWNFEKFLVNGKGKIIGRYSSSTKPLNSTLEKSIKNELF